jgi:hypothetical protein
LSTKEKIALRDFTKNRVEELIKNSRQLDDLIDLIKLAG